MPLPMPALEMMKQQLLIDGSSKLTEAQAMEWALAEQVAQRRRMVMYKNETDILARQLQDQHIKPADLHGLSPAEMMQTLGTAAQMKAEDDAAFEQEAYRQRSSREDRAYADELAAKVGRAPGSVILRAEGQHAPDPDPDIHGLVQRPTPYGTAKLPGAYGSLADVPLNHPAEERYGRLDDIRIATGNDAKFYGGLARGTDDPYEFARVLAGQLTAQRLREMGPSPGDDGLDSMLYIDPAQLTVY